MPTIDELREAALKLSEADRAILAHDLIESLNPSADEREWAEAWADEIHDRYEEYLRGEVVPIDGEEFIRQVRAELHGGKS